MNINKTLSILVLTLLVGLLPCGCKTQNSTMTKSNEKEITEFLSTSYWIVHKVEEIPKNIQKLFFRKITNQKLANPDEEFNSTDLIIDPNVPRRRLVFAGNSASSSFVCYEHGGRGLHCHLVIFSVDRKTAQITFNGTYFYKPKNLNQLKQWVRENKFDKSDGW